MLRRALALLAVLAIALGGPGPAALAQVLTPVGSGSAAAPVVSGTPAVGSVLTVPAYSGVTDQWLRNGSAIGGATSTSYTVVSADQGTTVSAALTLAGLSVPAPTGFFLPTVASSPLIAAGTAAMVSGYAGPLINVYNAAATTNQDFAASGGQFPSRTAVQAFQSTSYLGARKFYNQGTGGSACDLTQTTAAQMLQYYTDGTGVPTAISGNDATKNKSAWPGGGGTGNPRSLLIGSGCQFNRQGVTIFWVGRNPAATSGLHNAYLEMGDLTTGSGADLAWHSPSFGADFITANESAGVIKDHSQVDQFAHGIYGIANMAVHGLRLGSTEATIKAHVDNRSIALNAEGFTWTSRLMTSGGRVGVAASATAAFSSNGSYNFADTGALLVYPTVLSDADYEAVRQALLKTYGAADTPTFALCMCDADSITLGFGTSFNQSLAKLLDDSLVTKNVMITNAGLGGQYAETAGSQTWFTDRNGTPCCYGQLGGAVNIAVPWLGHNDLATGATGTPRTAVQIEGYLTTIVANARSAGYGKVCLPTILPGNDITGGQETQRGLLNTWIVANSVGADCVINYAANTTMGNGATSYNNTALYADGVHPTDLGYTYLLVDLRAVLASAFSISQLDLPKGANDNGRYAPTELAA